MLALLYLLLFLALSAAATWWRVASFRRVHQSGFRRERGAAQLAGRERARRF
jgi:membrane protein implicated in regulation of membrane protease activity